MQGESSPPSILPGGSLLRLPPVTSRRRRCPLIPSPAARHLLSERAGPELGERGGGGGGAVRENGISFFGCTSVRTPRQGIHLLRLYSCYVQLGCQAPPGETCPSSQAGGFPARKPESGNLYIIPGFLLYFFQYSSFSLSFSESRLHRNLIIRSPFFSGQIRFSLSRSVSMNVYVGTTPWGKPRCSITVKWQENPFFSSAPTSFSSAPFFALRKWVQK